MDDFGYVIGKILSQLILNDLGQWYPVIFFFQKMIPIETQDKTHNDKLLAIIELFKTWRHYLESCKH